MSKKKKKKRGRLKARGASQYDNKTHGKGDSSMPPDDRTLKTNLCRVTMMRPKFNDGPLIFRPWPVCAYENPEVLAPGRKSTEARGMSDWIVRVPVAKYVGLNDPSCEKVSFCLRLPWDQEGKRNNPFAVLSYAAHDAHDAGQFGPGRKWDVMWNKILKGRGNQGAELTKPTAVWFAQGIIFANGNKDYTSGRDLPLGMDENDDLVVIQMSISAGNKILDLLDAPKKGFDGDAEERPWEAYRYGDPTGVYDPKTEEVSGGVILTLFNPEKTKNIKKNTTWDPDATSDSFKGYEAAVRLSYKGADGDKFPAALRAQDVENVFARSQFWFDDGDEKGLIHIPSVEEQCVLLAKAFRATPKLLTFAWADHEDTFLTDDVMGILNARKSAVMPGDDDEEEDTDDEEFADDKKSKRPKKDPTQSSASDDEDDDDEFEDEDPKPKKKKKGKSKTKAKTKVEDDDEFEDEDDEVEDTAADDDDEFEDEDDDKGEVEADGDDDEDEEYPDDVDDDDEEEEDDDDDDDDEEEVEDENDKYFEEDESEPDTESDDEEIDDDDAEEAKMRASLDEAKKRGGKRSGKKKTKAKTKAKVEEPAKSKKKKARAENPAEKKKKKKKS